MLTILAVADRIAHVEGWMQQAFYPVLLLILVAASLGVPLPEDIPLIAAGVLLRTNPEIASWQGTIAVALVGIMVGDLVLYMLGRRWGPEVLKHRYICWFLTPDRFARISRRFHRHGTWFCFFGRFLMGIRAAMCITAGATHFPYWRFLLADLAGATVSAPLFLLLGYWFAGMIPTLLHYLADAETSAFAVAVVAAALFVLAYRTRKQRRARRIAALRAASDRDGPASNTNSSPAPRPPADSRRSVPSIETERSQSR